MTETDQRDTMHNNDEMPFLEHLAELRRRIIYSLLAVLSGFIVAMFFSQDIFTILAQPLLDVLPEGEKKIVFTSLPDVFFMHIKIALFTGILLGSPVIFFQIYRFIAPALQRSSLGGMFLFVSMTTLFFTGGILFSYFQIFPVGFKFFIGFSGENIEPMITIREYLKLSIRLLLAFGTAFQLPIIISFMAWMGLVTPAFLARNRKYALLIIVFFAAIITPPDVVTQLLMAVPLYFLYELSIIGAWFFGMKHRKRRNAALGINAQ